jgi:hypothetical protein
MNVFAMAVIAIVVVALPVILMIAFNADNVSDSRGRRIFHHWHV